MDLSRQSSPSISTITHVSESVDEDNHPYEYHRCTETQSLDNLMVILANYRHIVHLIHDKKLLNDNLYYAQIHVILWFTNKEVDILQSQIR